MKAVFPRILSRPGPSAVFRGVPKLGTTYKNFSTATYLDLYKADPDSGTIIVPVGIKPSDVIATAPLSPQVFSEFIWYALAANFDGWKIYEDQAPILIEEGRTGRPLPATADEWVLINHSPEVAQDIAAIFDDGSSVGNKLGGICLVHSKGKFINFVSLAHFKGSHIQVGCLGTDAAASQQMYIDPQGQVFTKGYHFEFRGSGLKGLRKSLGLSEAPLFHFVLEIAARIYNSGQYVSQELGPLQIRDGMQWHRLDFDGSIFFGPEGIDPSSDDYVIRSQGSADERAPEEHRLPLFSLEGRISEEASERLSVDLTFPLFQMYPSLIPLAPSLKEKFWDPAVNMVVSGLIADGSEPASDT